MTNHPVDGWIKKAETDLAACRKLAQDNMNEMADVVCFHAQQCAEKYLKAFLNKTGRDAPKIHSLKVLVELAREADAEFENLLEDAGQLEEYAVEFRYPGESATEEEAHDALRKAAGIREFVRLKILK